MKKNGKYDTICFRPVKRKLTAGWLNIIHLLTFKLKVGQLIFKKQLEHFGDDSIDPLNLSTSQPRTIIMTEMVSEGVKIFLFVTLPHLPPTSHQIKIIQNIYNVLNITGL